MIKCWKCGAEHAAIRGAIRGTWVPLEDALSALRAEVGA